MRPLALSHRYAEQLAVACVAAGLPDVSCWDMAACDAEALLASPASKGTAQPEDATDTRAAAEGRQLGLTGLAPGTAVLMVVSTYEGGGPPEKAKWFCRCAQCYRGTYAGRGAKSLCVCARACTYACACENTLKAVCFRPPQRINCVDPISCPIA